MAPVFVPAAGIRQGPGDAGQGRDAGGDPQNTLELPQLGQSSGGSCPDEKRPGGAQAHGNEMRDASTAGALSVQIGRYAVSGLANTALGLGVIFALHGWAGLGVVPSNVVGYLLGWILSYGLNRNWTFAHRGDMRRSFPAFIALVLGAFLVNIALVSGLTSAGLTFLVAQLAGAFCYSLIVFIGSRHVVFPSGH